MLVKHLGHRVATRQSWRTFFLKEIYVWTGSAWLKVRNRERAAAELVSRLAERLDQRAYEEGRKLNIDFYWRLRARVRVARVLKANGI